LGRLSKTSCEHGAIPDIEAGILSSSEYSSSSTSKSSADSAHEYKEVHALYFNWAGDDLGVKEEARALTDVLADVLAHEYKVISSTLVQIPSENSFPLVEAFLNQLKKLVSHPDNLIIVYYAGHGSLDKYRRMMWHAYGFG
jgi:hypothetical protein